MSQTTTVQTVPSAISGQSPFDSSRSVAHPEIAAVSDPASAVNMQAMFAHAPMGIFRSTDQRLLHVNPKFASMFGYAGPEQMLHSPATWYDLAADRSQWDSIIQAALKSDDYVRHEARCRRKEGGTFLAQLFMRAVRNIATSGIILEGFIEDITGHRELQEGFRHAQRMEAIGQLAGGIAHDFNNILTASLLHLSLLQEDSTLPPVARDTLREVELETQRAVNLTRQLLLFSRRHAAQMISLDVNALINELLKMLKRLLGENIHIRFFPAPTGAWTQADPGMLEQVVTNLCVNARDAMSRGGSLTITTAVVEFTASISQHSPMAREGRFVCLAVSDTGCGMDQAVLKRLFEPFFTTKESGRGTGLGLATAYGIVKQHEGWIEVESAAGQGSKFIVYLPAVALSLENPVANSVAELIPRGSETILLVEDDIALRRTTALCLRNLGYAVLEAADGRAAVDIWRRDWRRIELLFTDQVMPQMVTGLDLAQELRKDNAGLPVIISSGYTAEQENLMAPAIMFLAKPYHRAHLAKIVRQCLDQAAQAKAAQPFIGQAQNERIE